MSTPVVYVIRENPLTKPVKIGTDTKWPHRFRAAASHTPREIEAAAIWILPNPEFARVLDATFRRELARAAHSQRVLEWYDLTLDEAVRKIEPLLPAGSVLTLSPTIAPLGLQVWDDWREIRPKYRGFSWRMWMFREHSPQQTIKVSYGALYDTHFRYAFTYNPWPVFLIGGFEHPTGSRANDVVAAAWTELMSRFGQGHSSRHVGWLRQGIAASDVSAFLVDRGLVPFPLARPKPTDAPAKEASIVAVRYGDVPPQTWVRDIFHG